MKKPKRPKIIKIAVEFEIRKDVWMKLPEDLSVKSKMAKAKVYDLTPADLVAGLVLIYALPNKKAKKVKSRINLTPAE